MTRSGPRRAPSGEWRPAGRASGPAPVGGPVRCRAPVRPRPGPSGCVRPRPGPDLPFGAPSGTGLVASMLASARRRAPSGAKFPRPEVSVGRPVRRRRPDRTSGGGPFDGVRGVQNGFYSIWPRQPAPTVDAVPRPRLRQIFALRALCHRGRAAPTSATPSAFARLIGSAPASKPRTRAAAKVRSSPGLPDPLAHLVCKFWLGSPPRRAKRAATRASE